MIHLLYNDKNAFYQWIITLNCYLVFEIKRKFKIKGINYINYDKMILKFILICDKFDPYNFISLKD